MTNLDKTARFNVRSTVKPGNTEVGIVLQLADSTGASPSPGAIVACNETAQTLLGMTIDQLQNATSTNRPWQTIHPDGSNFPGETHPAMVALDREAVPQCRHEILSTRW